MDSTNNQSSGDGSRGMRILLVDDNLINQKVMARMIQAVTEAEIASVDSGEAALEKLRGERFDLVFMDVQLDGMDGIEATEKIRGMNESATGPDVPVVMLSGYSDSESERRAKSAGATDYLMKPVDPGRLATLVKKVRSAPI